MVERTSSVSHVNEMKPINLLCGRNNASETMRKMVHVVIKVQKESVKWSW